MSDSISTPFFLAGGALSINAPSYIEREADTHLFTSLLRSEFCYVLTSRQMGKSSLMMRTAARLRQEGVAAIVLDLNAFGHDLTREQWYISLTLHLARRLNVLREVRAFWEQASDLSPLQRWVGAIQHILQHLHAGPLVVFIDEIDQVRLLDFNVDEFFAAIRSCYSGRPEDPEYNRLTFCLLGVALPSELIRDPQLTPFNIGTHIELTDFTEAQTLGLTVGLDREEIVGEVLLERVYFWTNGHPYLTQRLCQAIVETPEVGTPQQVDTLCERLFLSSEAHEQDDNLIFVRDRLLRSLNDERDVANLLTLYDRIVAGKSVPDRKSDALVGVLRLSGIARPVGSLLQVRNRIYERVFDRRWVREHMPGAELRRQRAAYFLGLLRAVAVSLILLTGIGSLALIALDKAGIARIQTHVAKVEADRANQERMNADQARKDTERLLYAADMNVAQQAYEKGEYGRLEKLLEAHRPKPGDKEDLRGFEWRLLWGLMHQDVHTFIHPGNGIVFSVAFSPNGKILASSDAVGTIKLWDMTTWRKIATLYGPAEGVFSLAFSPKGNRLAGGCLDKTVRVWDIKTLQDVKILTGYTGEIHSVAFSPDGRWLVSCTSDYSGDLILWDTTTWNRVISRGAHAHLVMFSPDGRWLVSAWSVWGDGEIKLWKFPFRQATVPLHTGSLYSSAFSPDNKTLAVGGLDDGRVDLWNISSKKKLATLRGHKATVNGLAFSPNGKYLATGSWDETIRLWKVSTRQIAGSTIVGHTNRVTSVAFSPSGKWLASGGSNEVKIWNPWHRNENPHQLAAFPNAGLSHGGNWLTFSPSGELRQFVFNPATKTVMLWDCVQERTRPIYHAQASPERMQEDRDTAVAYSSDGRLLAIGTADGKVLLLDAASGRQLMEPLQVDIHSIPRPGIDVLAFTSNSRMLAGAGGNPAIITLWDLASGQQIAQFKHTNDAQGITFSPDGKMLAAANWQGRVYLWDIATGKQTAWWAHAQPVNDVAFSPDGKTLATASDDDTVKLWNVATQREMVTLAGPKGHVSSVAFSPDGNQLAALSDGKKVWVWEAASLADADRSH